MIHHACLVRQNKRDVDHALTQYQNDDDAEIVVLTYDTITIADVRSIIAAASRRPTGKSVQLLVICFTTIHTEAEQALLKIIEEPPETTKFLFVVPETYRPLPTIASRVYDITTSDEETSPVVNETFKNFLTSSYKDRLALAVKGGGEAKDLLWVAEMKNGLRHYLALHRTTMLPGLLQVYLDVLSRLDTKGASNKMLFEELALTLRSA